MSHRIFLVLIPVLVTLVGACPPARSPGPTSTTELTIEEEDPSIVILRRAMEELDKNRIFTAEYLAQQIPSHDPLHLEALVFMAMLHEVAEENAKANDSWIKVERILVYTGKLVPFEMQQTLFAAARHYIRLDKNNRSKLFLDELWRRFPKSPWSVKAQMMLVESAFSKRRWSEVSRACNDLLRLHTTTPSAHRCRQLMKVSDRLVEVGPEPTETRSTWVWDHPLPQGNTLRDVWVGPGGEVIAVGERGTILQAPKGGRTFSVAHSPTRWNLNRLWGTGAENVYAVGDAGQVLHFNGTSWQVLRKADPLLGDLTGAYSAGPGHLVTVARTGHIWQLKDGAWEEGQPTSVPLYCVWGAGPDDLFAAGKGGLMLRYSAGRWNVLPSDSYEDLWSIWGESNSFMFAVGSRKTVIFFDGKEASESVVGFTGYQDVWGQGGEVWAVGQKGGIAHFDKRRGWQTEKSGTLAEINGVSGSSARDVWAVGEGGLMLRRRGWGWTMIAGSIREDLVAVAAGPAPGQALALGHRGILLSRTQRGWSRGSLPVAGRYRDLWQDGNRAVAVGDHGLILARDGRKWQQVKSGTSEDLNSVVGWDSGVVVVGTRGTILRIQGDQVIPDRPPTGLELRGVWAGSARDMVAVGARGAVLQFNGDEWLEQESGVLTNLHAVWGTSTRLIAVGAGGTIIQRVEGQWQPMTSPTSQSLEDIWGGSPDQIFAISRQGGVFHFNGTAWRVQRSPAACLLAIHGDPATGVLASGCNGTVLRWKLEEER